MCCKEAQEVAVWIVVIAKKEGKRKAGKASTLRIV